MINDDKINVSIIIVTYNSKNYIGDCIDSIKRQDIPDNFLVEIVIVDNQSKDDTIDFLKRNYSPLKIIENNFNLGYGMAINIGVANSQGDYIVILNPDTVVEEGWLKGLIIPLINSEKLITTPKVLLYDGSMINSCGLIVHFTGLAFTRGFKVSSDNFCTPEFVGGVFGCCFAMKKNEFIELGGFDGHIFLYGEDTEFSWRANSKGFKILFVPDSVVRHDYVLKVPPKKIYHLEKARYIILRKYFSLKNLLFIFPSLILAELLTFGYSIKFGFRGLRYKLMAIKDGLFVKVDGVDSIKNNYVKALDTTIPIDQLTYNPFEKALKIIFNKIFELNWRLIFNE